MNPLDIPTSSQSIYTSLSVGMLKPKMQNSPSISQSAILHSKPWFSAISAGYPTDYGYKGIKNK